MSEEPECKRRRCQGPTAAGGAISSTSLDALPDAVLQHCFSFTGPGVYRFVAGTSRHFRELYSAQHEKRTKWDRAAASISCSELCLKDAREQAQGEEDAALEKVTVCASVEGNVKILEWARKKGFEFTPLYFRNAASGHGYASVLQWAEENNLEWYSEMLIKDTARRGAIAVLDFIHSIGREIPPETARSAAANGQVAVLTWMKERYLLRIDEELPGYAALNNHIDVLEWLYDNGYDFGAFIELVLIMESRDLLLWARQQGIVEWSADFCAHAALFGNLPFLQWLRENDCPWDARVVRARDGNDELIQWAIENGCPTE